MDGLKQRIIGALVLISLAVIFVPMLFDEPHSERTSSSIRIPEEPPFPEVEAPLADIPETPAYRIEEIDASDEVPEEPVYEESREVTEEGMLQRSAPATADADPSQESTQPAEPTSNSAQLADPVTDDGQPPTPANEAESAEFTRSLEGAWVVQLGSFGSSENARRLREKVREKGYSSHLQEITRGDNQLTRVFSGPFAEKAEAERAKQALDKAFGLNSLVTSGDR